MIEMAIELPKGHAPKEWVVVSQLPLIVSAMCICGNDDCHYTVSAYMAVNVNLHPTHSVVIV
jgi:hypothetical protein